eukprot:comp21583_c1_seq1/m.30168 comp21583_c1_seq1/g.30168  ORF comp21583_c1_seq1/g.30168 comp21583_c1_seq1/m.30168 type:complete len:549 (-) comp21583_c1_seq1:25-1671(-)
MAHEDDNTAPQEGTIELNDKSDKSDSEDGGMRSRSASLSSLISPFAESTRRAWERVTEAYKNNPRANLTDVTRGYSFLDPFSSPRLIGAVAAAILAFLVWHTYITAEQLYAIAAQLQANVIGNVVEVVLVIAFLYSILVYYSIRRPRPVYLLDFATFKPPSKNTTPHELFMDLTRRTNVFDKEAIEFQEKLLNRNGLGQKTAFPDAMFRAEEIAKSGREKVLNMQSAREEAELVMFSVVKELLDRNNLKAKDIDILIVNCSLFNPTPSLSAMIVNHFKMRDDIRTYNLSGMGCSAGVISIDLARDLLQVQKNVTAIVVSTENITQNWYLGKQKSMLLTNTLFRMGGAAILLSNKVADKRRARYRLLNTVRTHRGADDGAFQSVYQMEDDAGIVGVRLSKAIMDVSGVALRQNITTLGPLILPVSQQVKFFINYIRRKHLGHKHLQPFIPDFKTAIQHFCIHTGGRAVIDTLENVLSLSEYDVTPSRFALERFGNTSSASIWYELEYMERAGRMRVGDKIWQIAFGSGFKCNSAVWQSMCSIKGDTTDY